ncbi:MAG: FAD-dependent oxidoreductase [Desulfobacterales bacterium]|jgi:predicted NAD/FAD-dependent oxidoreductase
MQFIYNGFIFNDFVIIVGAGIACLSCAWRLHAAGMPFQILEGSDRIGGRVKTDPAVRIKRGIYVCGEYHSAPPIQWAMVSGRRAAEALIADLPE